MNNKYLLKIILFTAIIAALAKIGSFILPICEIVMKVAIVAVLIEVGYLIFIKLFGKNE